MHFKPYVYGTQFTIRTDHKPLIYLFGLKNPSQRLLRIRLELEEYTFDIEHIKGKDNVVADALSRISFEEIKDCHQNVAQISVTTRSMANQKDKQNKQQEDRKIESNTEYPKVYLEENVKNRKIPELIIKNKVLEARINKRILFTFTIERMIRDSKLSLEKFLLQLQLKATKRDRKY